MPSERKRPNRGDVGYWTALLIFLAVLLGGVVLVLVEESISERAAPVTTVETTEEVQDEDGTTTTTRTQTTTAPVPEPSVVKQLTSPTTTALAKLIVILVAAFLTAALLHRALLGRYAIKLPGGLEIPDVEATPEDLGELSQQLSARPALGLDREGRPVLPEDGVLPPPENREQVEEIFIETPKGELTLVQLRQETERVLWSLAVPRPAREVQRPADLVDVLVIRGVLTPPLAGRLTTLLRGGDQAAAGARISPQMESAVQQSGAAILQQLADMRRTMGRDFEAHVLDELVAAVPSAIVDTDVPLNGMRVDAVVQRDSRRVVVEIKTLLGFGDSHAENIAEDFVGSLSADAPVLLVVPGHGLDDEVVESIESNRQGQVRQLLWDTQSHDLARVVDQMLNSTS